MNLAPEPIMNGATEKNLGTESTVITTFCAIDENSTSVMVWPKVSAEVKPYTVDPCRETFGMSYRFSEEFAPRDDKQLQFEINVVPTREDISFCEVAITAIVNGIHLYCRHMAWIIKAA